MHGVRRRVRLHDGSVNPEVVQNGSERHFGSLCGRIQISLA